MVTGPIFYQTITAAPLFEIFRSLVAQMLADKSFRVARNINDKEYSTFQGVLTYIAGGGAG